MTTSTETNKHRGLKAIALWCVNATVVAIILLTLVALMGKVSWWMDLWAQFRVQFLAVLVVLLIGHLFIGGRRTFWFLLGCTVINCFPLMPYLIPCNVSADTNPTEGVKPTRVILFNVSVNNDRYSDALRFFDREQADVVVTLESHAQWTRGLSPLARDYPHRFLEDDRGSKSVAIYSKLPFESCKTETGGAGRFSFLNVKLLVSGKPVHLLATHPPTPFTAQSSALRNEQLFAVADSLEQNNSRILLGDFNMTPWSPYFGDILKRGNIRPAGFGYGISPTWYQPTKRIGVPAASRLLRKLGLTGLKLDHVLLSPDFRVINYRVGPNLGSDHLPVIVDIL